MKTTSTRDNVKDSIDFNFDTSYIGNDITLHVVSNHGLYSVLHEEKPIGNIKLGEINNTWYVVDKNYTPIYLLDAIANQIASRLQFS
jgi:hypothetical protein